MHTHNVNTEIHIQWCVYKLHPCLTFMNTVSVLCVFCVLVLILRIDAVKIDNFHLVWRECVEPPCCHYYYCSYLLLLLSLLFTYYYFWHIAVLVCCSPVTGYKIKTEVIHVGFVTLLYWRGFAVHNAPIVLIMTDNGTGCTQWQHLVPSLPVLQTEIVFCFELELIVRPCWFAFY